MKKRGNIATLKPQRAGEPSHNPHGRPKKDKCFGDIAREMMDSKEIEISLTLPSGVVKKIGIKSDKTIKQSIIAAMIREAMTGNMQAAKELIDRVDGKVTEKIRLEDEHDAESKKAHIEMVQTLTKAIETGNMETILAYTVYQNNAIQPSVPCNETQPGQVGSGEAPRTA
jgi:hypothetical protein